MYDLIGDIHGYATELKALLTKMNYQEIDGVWQHPERKVIFLGDFVDKGPEQVEVVRIAKAMVESDNAQAVMGNHEYNAVLWATEQAQSPGDYLRTHIPKNRNQHREFLEQVIEGSELHLEFVEWFKKLPLYLDMEGLRVVHACWHPDHLNVVEKFTDQNNCLSKGSWEESANKETELFEAIEVLLKGLEVKLPEGIVFFDAYGHERTNIRTKWWQTGQDITFKNMALAPPSVIKQIPEKSPKQNVLPGYDGMKPVFVGHYWLTGTPAPFTEHVACLDYSVAADKNGKLCAYQWDGELQLDQNKFCYVNRLSA